MYIAKSPEGKNGNWGNNIIGSYEILEGRGWKMWKFEPGTYDVKVTYVEKYGSRTYTSYDNVADDGEGRKFDMSSSGTMFIIDFTFEN